MRKSKKVHFPDRLFIRNKSNGSFSLVAWPASWPESSCLVCKALGCGGLALATQDGHRLVWVTASLLIQIKVFSYLWRERKNQMLPSWKSDLLGVLWPGLLVKACPGCQQSAGASGKPGQDTSQQQREGWFVFLERWEVCCSQNVTWVML